jgi:hypothetical protein
MPYKRRLPVQVGRLPFGIKYCVVWTSHGWRRDDKRDLLTRREIPKIPPVFLWRQDSCRHNKRLGLKIGRTRQA